MDQLTSLQLQNEVFRASPIMESFFCRHVGLSIWLAFFPPFLRHSRHRLNTGEVPSFKVVVVGDKGTGKTTFLRRFRNAEIVGEAMGGTGPVVRALDFEIPHVLLRNNSRRFRCYCLDTEDSGGLRDGYIVHADYVIIMIDVNDNSTYMNVPRYYRYLRRILGWSIPIVLCGNKVDIENRQVQFRHVTFPLKYHVQYFEISALANYNIDEPFIYLAIEHGVEPRPRGVNINLSALDLAPPEIDTNLVLQQHQVVWRSQQGWRMFQVLE